MAGKPRTDKTKTDLRGGKRDGAGRKPAERPDYDENFKARVTDAVEKLAKKHGFDFVEAAIGMLYDPDVLATAKVGVFRTIAEVFTIKKTETKSIKEFEPVVILPASDPDPALRVVNGGKQ